MTEEQIRYRRNKKKRNLIRPRQMKPVGIRNGGKICYPTSIKSYKKEWNYHHLHGFQVQTHFHSIVTKKQTPLTIIVWSYTNPDSLQETIGVRVQELPIFLKQDDVVQVSETWFITNQPNHHISEPRRLIVPHRKTLDNYQLNISVFQLENYIGIPTYMASRDKLNITEGWLYGYNTIVNGMEGVYMEADSVVPYAFTGNVHLV